MKTAGAILDGHAWASNWGNNLGTVLPGSAANIGFNRFVLAPQYDCATITSTSITSTNAPADADMVTLVKAAMVAGMTIGLKPLVRPNDGDIQGHLTGGGFVAHNTAVYSTGSNTMTISGGSFDSSWIGRRVITPTPGHYEEIPSGLTANAYGLATPTWTTITAASGTSITLSARPNASSSNGYVVIADDTAAATWFANYQTILDHLIGLVVNPTGSGGAGCPNTRLTVDISTEHDFLHIIHDSKWRSLIAHLRAAWPGVTLTAGAPAVNGYNIIRCFDVLDYLGATWYEPVQTLAGGETTAVISQNTSAYIATLAAWSAAWSNKQILFTEVGFRSVDAGGGSFPAGYQPSQSSGGTAGEVSQAQCVRAFLDTIYQQSWFGGFHWWAWQYPQNASSTGEATSFSVTNADGSLKQAAREFSSTLRVLSAGRELAPTIDGKSLIPVALLTDVSAPRVFNGPLDPSQISAVRLTAGDNWCRAVAPVIVPTGPPLDPPPAGMLWAPATLQNTGAEAKTSLLGRTRSRINGDVTLSPAASTLRDADVYGQVKFATSGTPWTAYLDNVRVHGTDLGFAALQASVAPGDRSTNYESSKGLVQNTGASNCTVHMDGVTLIPDFPDSRWDGFIGHDLTVDGWGLVIAHCTDAVGVQNTPAGSNPPLNIDLGRTWIGFLCYWSYSPGSPNTPQETHNDGMQGFGGRNVQIHNGTVINGWQSMPNGFVHPDGSVHDDPFGYVGQGRNYIPPSGNTVQGATNSCIQLNITQSAVWTGLVVEDAYLNGGDFAVNGTTGISFDSTSRIQRVRYDRSQYKWPTQYPLFNITAAGMAVDSSSVLYSDTGTSVPLR